MNYLQLKTHRAWKQLDRQEKRFLKAHLESPDPKLALRARIIFERADKKAEAQERITFPPPELPITIGDSSMQAKFTNAGLVELSGDVIFEGLRQPVTIVLESTRSGDWVVLTGEGSEQLQNFVAQSFSQWTKAHPNFLKLVKQTSILNP